jgi:hypothetical protein
MLGEPSFRPVELEDKGHPCLPGERSASPIEGAVTLIDDAAWPGDRSCCGGELSVEMELMKLRACPSACLCLDSAHADPRIEQWDDIGCEKIDIADLPI